ncbi:peptide-methionine (S)-S-oxide reductase MsrA [Pseudemcibacter aquimaris]|uniref:peptide-methionine (S)-S-oxide reductase MsrA n=1 Tax=Pseudemcibacter aquimaris TaxID=2857064 RepID=UPI002011C5CD|nr:peptide-methionine (S)-S-oxide reductase MsrA [Pseudemcibacter aquimaris]MCC3861927.1 peptide-methionine (S)-S-oxide reductase MsrA [Pseudemcibacter aquimaris]WDU58679.1 peptide-methionine (S)-S-oxide reductase MsrA [Pseudemcibacter aquimaris]
MEKAIFAAGCFWGVELNFSKVEGVKETKVGYIGGDTENPTYEEVCGKGTKHAEAIEIMYDPDVISFEGLLENLWEFHDPTTLNRQGPDVGTQYRSAVFYLNDEQKAAAEKSIADLDASGKFKDPVVTSLEEATTFWPAEEYHQKYLEKKGITIACV